MHVCTVCMCVRVHAGICTCIVCVHVCMGACIVCMCVMCTCMCTCVLCVHVHVCACSMCVCTCVLVSALCAHMCVHVCLYCVRVYTCVHVCTCVCVCLYCVHACVCMRAYIVCIHVRVHTSAYIGYVHVCASCGFPTPETHPMTAASQQGMQSPHLGWRGGGGAHPRAGGTAPTSSLHLWCMTGSGSCWKCSPVRPLEATPVRPEEGNEVLQTSTKGAQSCFPGGGGQWLQRTSCLQGNPLLWSCTNAPPHLQAVGRGSHGWLQSLRVWGFHPGCAGVLRAQVSTPTLCLPLLGCWALV